MKRHLLIAVFAAAGVLSACGAQTQNVTRGQSLPLTLKGFVPDHAGATSSRSSIDLLSLG